MQGPRIILVRTKDSANVGAAARAMLNFGLDELVLVAPRCAIDKRAHALATHASAVLDAARVVGSLAEAVADRRLVLGTSARMRTAENFPVLTPKAAAQVLLEPSVAVVFGPEDHGLDNDDLNLCQAHVVIPTADFSSLNLAQAVVVVAYEVFQARALAASEIGDGGEHADFVPNGILAPGLVGWSDRRQVEGLYAHLLETFHLIGFTDVSRARSIDRLMRGMFDRVALAPREVAALRGFLSQVAWAARQPPESFPPQPEDASAGPNEGQV